MENLRIYHTRQRWKLGKLRLLRVLLGPSGYSARPGNELEDFIELRDANVKASIAAGRKDRASGKTRPTGKLLAELKRRAF
jgi:hypothetical protein